MRHGISKLQEVGHNKRALELLKDAILQTSKVRENSSYLSEPTETLDLVALPPLSGRNLLGVASADDVTSMRDDDSVQGPESPLHPPWDVERRSLKSPTSGLRVEEDGRLGKRRSIGDSPASGETAIVKLAVHFDLMGMHSCRCARPTPMPRDVLERLTTVRGGPLPLPGPSYPSSPPLYPDFVVGENEIYKRNIDLGYFWDTDLWVPGPPPPLF